MDNNEMTLDEFLNTLYKAWEVSCKTASCPLKLTIEKVREEFQKMKSISTHTFEQWLRHCYNNWTTPFDITEVGKLSIEEIDEGIRMMEVINIGG